MDAVQVAYRWFDRVWRERDFDAVDELMAPDAVAHLPSGQVVGPAGFKEIALAFIQAIPDIRLEVFEIIGSGSSATARWRVSGTHTGPGFGLEPSGRPVDFVGTTWIRTKSGRIVEGGDEWDFDGLMKDLSSPR